MKTNKFESTFWGGVAVTTIPVLLIAGAVSVVMSMDFLKSDTSKESNVSLNVEEYTVKPQPLPTFVVNQTKEEKKPKVDLTIQKKSPKIDTTSKVIENKVNQIDTTK